MSGTPQRQEQALRAGSAWLAASGWVVVSSRTVISILGILSRTALGKFACTPYSVILGFTDEASFTN